MRRTIEIEFRTMFSKAVHDRLLRFLGRYGRDLGKDDKDVFFYMFPGRLYKVVNNISKQTAKIVLKKNRIGRGSHFEEIEIPIARTDVSKAVSLIDSLGAPETDHEFQARHNYIWRGVEIAVKYSGTWGHHAEFEVVIDDPKKKQAAEEKIHKVAEALGVRLMTDDDLKIFLRQVAKSRRWRKKRRA